MSPLLATQPVMVTSWNGVFGPSSAGPLPARQPLLEGLRPLRGSHARSPLLEGLGPLRGSHDGQRKAQLDGQLLGCHVVQQHVSLQSHGGDRSAVRGRRLPAPFSLLPCRR
jgi:hypothetical protein